MSIMLTLSNKGAMMVVDCKPSDNSVWIKINILISQPKQMLWVPEYFVYWIISKSNFSDKSFTNTISLRVSTSFRSWLGVSPLFVIILTVAGKGLTLYLLETPFNPFTNRADPDQAALVRAAWSVSTLFAYGNMIYLILH